MHVKPGDYEGCGGVHGGVVDTLPAPPPWQENKAACVCLRSHEVGAIRACVTAVAVAVPVLSATLMVLEWHRAGSGSGAWRRAIVASVVKGACWAVYGVLVTAAVGLWGLSECVTAPPPTLWETVLTEAWTDARAGWRAAGREAASLLHGATSVVSGALRRVDQVAVVAIVALALAAAVLLALAFCVACPLVAPLAGHLRALVTARTHVTVRVKKGDLSPVEGADADVEDADTVDPIDLSKLTIRDLIARLRALGHACDPQGLEYRVNTVHSRKPILIDALKRARKDA
jgi:hypothetical protein